MSWAHNIKISSYLEQQKKTIPEKFHYILFPENWKSFKNVNNTYKNFLVFQRVKHLYSEELLLILLKEILISNDPNKLVKIISRSNRINSFFVNWFSLIKNYLDMPTNLKLVFTLKSLEKYLMQRIFLIEPYFYEGSNKQYLKKCIMETDESGDDSRYQKGMILKNIVNKAFENCGYMILKFLDLDDCIKVENNIPIFINIIGLRRMDLNIYHKINFKVLKSYYVNSNYINSFKYFQDDDLLKLLTLETVSYIIYFSNKYEFYLEDKESIDNVILENVKNCEGNYDEVIIDSIKKLFLNIKFYISKSSCFWKYYDKK